MLLSDSESQFSSLVNQTGAAESEHLRILAKIASKKLKSIDQKSDDHEDNPLHFGSGENDPLVV